MGSSEFALLFLLFSPADALCSAMMIFDHLPWLSYIVKQLGVGSNIKRLRAKGMARTEARYKRGAVSKDLFYYLVRILCYVMIFWPLTTI